MRESVNGYVDVVGASHRPVFELVDIGVAAAQPTFVWWDATGPAPQTITWWCRDCGTIPCWRHRVSVWINGVPQPQGEPMSAPRVGWKCPECNRCYAPHIDECMKCRPLMPGGM